MVLSTLLSPSFTTVVVTVQHLPAGSVDSPPSAAVEPSSDDVVKVDFLLKFWLLLKSFVVELFNKYCNAESVAPTLMFDMFAHIDTSSRQTFIANSFSSCEPCTIAPDTSFLISSADSRPVSSVQPTITKEKK